jgi:3-keto-5-aminohexanoate cleavage enzyme
MSKLIITVALNGSVPTKKMNPHTPITPDEIAEAAVRCRVAGASVAHVHARDLEGRATLDPDIFAEIHRLVSEKTDMVVQISTGGRADLDAEVRANPVLRIKPEMASLTTGSMNFPDQVYENSFETVETRVARLAAEAEREVATPAEARQIMSLKGMCRMSPSS